MCKCCKEIEFWNEHKPIGYKEKLFARITVYSWRKDVRAIKGKQFSIIDSKAFTLNYCPMCGRKLGE